MEFHPGLQWAMEHYPDIKDLVIEHKEVFTVHDDNAHEECYDCYWCIKCDEVFPKKGHLHPDCSRCITEGFSKHPCVNTQALKQSFTLSAFDLQYILNGTLTPDYV